MSDVKKLDEKAAARREALGEVMNHCPFGCKSEQLDEFGYCDHLVGFVSPKLLHDGSFADLVGQTVECVEWLIHPHQQGDQSAGHRHVTRAKTDKVRADDKIVNPQVLQKDEHGHEHMAHKWHSSRVYRDIPKEKGKAKDAA